MRKIIGVALLVTALTCSAYAGDMTNDITGGTQPSAPTSTTTAAPGDMQNAAPGEITNDATGTSSSQSATTSAVQVAASALGVVQSVLALI